MKMRYDRDADALYIHIREGAQVCRTEQLDHGTLIDLDERGALVGIELIRPARQWPLDAILSRFHLEAQDADLIRSLWQEGVRYPFEPAEVAVAG